MSPTPFRYQIKPDIFLVSNWISGICNHMGLSLGFMPQTQEEEECWTALYFLS